MKCAFLIATLLTFGFAPETGAEGPEWLSDLDRAFALAAEQERPLLVVFR